MNDFQHVFDEINNISKMFENDFGQLGFEEVQDFLEANEYGLALESLYYFLVDEKIPVSPDVRKRIEELANVMGINDIDVEKICAE